jgi:phage-related baseplate assembly protein
MDVFTWEPEKMDEVFKRREAEEIPEGYKIVGDRRSYETHAKGLDVFVKEI